MQRAPAQEEGVKLELSREMSYDAVAAALAGALGLADPQLLRFTQQNTYTQARARGPYSTRDALVACMPLQRHAHSEARGAARALVRPLLQRPRRRRCRRTGAVRSEHRIKNRQFGASALCRAAAMTGCGLGRSGSGKTPGTRQGLRPTP